MRPSRSTSSRLARRLYGDTGPRAVDRVTRAVVDVPYAAVRRHRAPLPDWLEKEVALGVRSLLTAHKQGLTPFMLERLSRGEQLGEDLRRDRREVGA